MKRLYLVERTDKVGWDQYVAFVVRAENEEVALKLCHEESARPGLMGKGVFMNDNTAIIEITQDGESKLILSDFNAG